MYRSILNQRQEAIDADAFRDAPLLIFNHAAPAEHDRRSVALWDRYVSYTPKQIYNLAARGYGDDMHVHVSLDKKGRFEYLIPKVSGVNDVLEVKGEFFLGKAREIGASTIEVRPKFHGMGAGKHWLRNNMELSAAFGFDHFAFVASLANGGYTWARAGAKVDDDIVRIPCPELRIRETSDILQVRLEAAKPFLPSGVYKDVRALCDINRMDDLVVLSGMGDVKIPRMVLDDSEYVMAGFYRDVYKDPAPSSPAFHQQQCLQKVFKSAAMRNKDVSLPQFLLSNVTYNAVVDFTNEVQMRHVERYVGGWKTIAPLREPAMA